jgi:hypothetical protein
VFLAVVALAPPFEALRDLAVRSDIPKMVTRLWPLIIDVSNAQARLALWRPERCGDPRRPPAMVTTRTSTSTRTRIVTTTKTGELDVDADAGKFMRSAHWSCCAAAGSGDPRRRDAGRRQRRHNDPRPSRR